MFMPQLRVHAAKKAYKPSTNTRRTFHPPPTPSAMARGRKSGLPQGRIPALVQGAEFEASCFKVLKQVPLRVPSEALTSTAGAPRHAYQRQGNEEAQLHPHAGITPFACD